MDQNMEKNKINLDSLIQAAEREDWDFVDSNISEEHLGHAQISWALNEGLLSADQNIRDLAATILDKSNSSLTPMEMEKLQVIMTEDSYHIVRFRLAIALYKRGDRSEPVLKIMDEAKDDPDVRELARLYLKIDSK